MRSAGRRRTGGVSAEVERGACVSLAVGIQRPRPARPARQPGLAWTLFFDDGFVVEGLKGISHSVRAVRDL